MKLTAIIGALVIALFAVLALGNFFGEKKPERDIVVDPQPVAAQNVQRNILVARQDIQIGTEMSAALYDIKPIAQHLIPPGAVVADDPNQAKVDGMITNTSIVTNQPILTSMLRNPNDPSYIAGQLGEGMRAVTIQVGLTESLGGLVNPGDKVDVLYAHNLTTYNVDSAALKSVKSDSDEAEQTANVNISEVLIPNLKVLAVDRRVSAGAQGEQNNQVVPQSVTLEVNLRDAQKLQLAAKMGKLSLALRSVKDKDKFDIVRPTAEQDLSRTMPPAYFSNLYDSDATYDFSVIDPYNGEAPEAGGARGKIKLYRGSQLQEVEVKK